MPERLAREEEDWVRLVQDEKRRVAAILRRAGVPAGDVADLTQVVFLRVVEALATGRPVERVDGLLSAVARSVAVDWHRTARSRVPLATAPVEDIGTTPAASRSHTGALETLVDIERAAEHLTTREREALATYVAFQLGRLDERTVSVLARRLGVRPNTLTVTWRRALAHLAELMDAPPPRRRARRVQKGTPDE